MDQVLNELTPKVREWQESFDGNMFEPYLAPELLLFYMEYGDKE